MFGNGRRCSWCPHPTATRRPPRPPLTRLQRAPEICPSYPKMASVSSQVADKGILTASLQEDLLRPAYYRVKNYGGRSRALRRLRAPFLAMGSHFAVSVGL